MYHMQNNNVVYNKSSSGTMFVIPDLQPSTTYVISVAAVNSEGIGVHGNVTASTLQCKLCYYTSISPSQSDMRVLLLHS